MDYLPTLHNTTEKKIKKPLFKFVKKYNITVFSGGKSVRLFQTDSFVEDKTKNKIWFIDFLTKQETIILGETIVIEKEN